MQQAVDALKEIFLVALLPDRKLKFLSSSRCCDFQSTNYSTCGLRFLFDTAYIFTVRIVLQAIDALKEIFLVALLPDRKLKFFEQQPLLSVPANKAGTRQLLFFYVEDCLKKRYAQFVTGLEECSRDNLEFLKDKALKAMYDLLRSKPEQVYRLQIHQHIQSRAAYSQHVEQHVLSMK